VGHPPGMMAVDPRNPQTWNRYAYVRNNPVFSIDPLGLDDCKADACVTAPAPPDVETYSVSPEAYKNNDMVFGQMECPDDTTAPCKRRAANNGTNCTPGTRGCFNVPQLCANVPTSPPGASATFNANSVSQESQGMWPATKLDFFYQTFRTGGTFDYKAGGGQYVDYGNWNFGYVCGANYPALFCQSAAGGYRMWRAATQGTNPFGSGFPFLKSPYGDQAPDNQQIRNGIQAQASGCVQ